MQSWRWFRNLKLAGKIGLAAGLIIALGAAGSLFAVQSLQAQKDRVIDLKQRQIALYDGAHEFTISLQTVRLGVFKTVAASDIASSVKEAATAKQDVVAADEIASELKQLTLTGEADEARTALLEAWKDYSAKLPTIFAALEANKKQEGRSLIDSQLTPIAVERLTPNLQKLKDLSDKSFATTINETEQAAASAVAVVLTVLVLTALVGVFFTIVLARSVIQPITEVQKRLVSMRDVCVSGMSKSMNAMKQGDLSIEVVPQTTPVPHPASDETGVLAQTFNEILAKVQATVGDYNDARVAISRQIESIQEQAQQVWSSGAGSDSSLTGAIREVTQTITDSAKTSHEMATASESLAMTATQAAQTVEEIDNAIQEMATLSSKVLAKSGEVQAEADQGRAALERLTRALGAIDERSEAGMKAVRELGAMQDQIGSIIQTIEDISEQTNLLALNAAIEAARAGESGRGFAVVAEEVRKLAERAGTSTKQIADLIASVRQGVERTHDEMASSLQAVKQGREVGSAAAEGLLRIADTVDEMKEIAVAAQGQAEGVAHRAAEVSNLVSTVASISEESAAGSEEISAGMSEVSASAQNVSRDLERIAGRLNEVVTSFHLAEESTSPRQRKAA